MFLLLLFLNRYAIQYGLGYRESARIVTVSRHGKRMESALRSEWETDATKYNRELTQG